MHNHFSKNLNLRNLILERKPMVVVECGAGEGELTRQLSSMIDSSNFNLYVISDKPVEGLDSRIIWKSGLSYNVLKEFEDDSIDFCIIDTDHNYWTLLKELEVLVKKMREGGVIALHDVETFYHDTGMALSYFTGDKYPKDEIESCSPKGGLGDALIDFLHSDRLHWKLLSYNKESHGAAAIEKRTQTHFSLITPGPGAIYAKKTEELVA